MANLAQLKSEMDAIQAQQAAWFNVQGEGARDWSPMDAKADTAVRAYTQALFAAEWTPEVIAARKAIWNAFVTSTGGNIPWAKLVAFQDAQGWSVDNLKSANAAAQKGA
jgi:hypothetical protein